MRICITVITRSTNQYAAFALQLICYNIKIGSSITRTNKTAYTDINNSRLTNFIGIVINVSYCIANARCISIVRNKNDIRICSHAIIITTLISSCRNTSNVNAMSTVIGIVFNCFNFGLCYIFTTIIISVRRYPQGIRLIPKTFNTQLSLLIIKINMVKLNSLIYYPHNNTVTGI